MMKKQFLSASIVLWCNSGIVSFSKAIPIYDLSKEYPVSDDLNTSPETKEMFAFSDSDPDVDAFVAIECGEIVGEYYDEGKDKDSQFQLWSMTKTWSGMLFGIMEKAGLISVTETLGDIWPNDTIWEGIDDAEDRKKSTVEYILQMRAGYNVGNYLPDVTADVGLGRFRAHLAGGKDLGTTLAYHPLNTSDIGSFIYLPVWNLVSYIIQTKTGKTPEEYANENAFPFLGITADDYTWYVNRDDVNLGFHGLNVNARTLSKLPMLYMQRGMASETDRVLTEDWVDRTFTAGDTSPDVDQFGYLYWVGIEPVYCTYGFLGQRACFNKETNRALVTLGGDLDSVLGVGEDDPTGLVSADDLVKRFLMDEPSTPVTCGSPTVESTGGTSDSSSYPMSVGVGLLVSSVACFLMSLTWLH